MDAGDKRALQSYAIYVAWHLSPPVALHVAGEPVWVDVLVDILLSLLGRAGDALPFSPLREACKALFRAVAEQVTPQGLEDLIRVVQPSPEGQADEEDEDVFEEDDEDEDEDDEEEALQGRAVCTALPCCPCCQLWCCKNMCFVLMEVCMRDIIKNKRDLLTIKKAPNTHAANTIPIPRRSSASWPH